MDAHISKNFDADRVGTEAKDGNNQSLINDHWNA